MSRALRSMSWTGMLVAFAFCVGLAAWAWSGMLLSDKRLSFAEHAEYFLMLVQRHLVTYFPIYILAALADALPLVGAKRKAAIAAALVAGALLSVQARCGLAPHQLIYAYTEKLVPFCSGVPTWSTYFDFPATVIVPLVTSTMVAIFVLSRRHDAELIEALHAARAAELEARRQRIESEMEAMQSRVDPDGLFVTLRGIREVYEASLADGEARLDRLIADLRDAARRPADASPEAAE